MITSQYQLVTSSTDAPAPRWGQSGEQPGMVARTLYKTSVCLSFGVVFPTLFVASLLPTKNAAGFGLLDGARAASDAQRRVHAGAVAAASTTKMKAGDAYAGVAARVSQRVEAIEDAIAERRYRRRIVTT